MARAAAAEMRSLIFELRPADLDSEGLVATLRKHVEVLSSVHGIEIEFKENGYRRLEPEVEREIYRVAQEAVGNALKHANAGKIQVQLGLVNGTANLTVVDDGRGFDPDASQVRATRLGITSMEERAEAIGGSLKIESGQKGTRVCLEVPLE
jgi:signal transduction histidine kinase